MSQENVEVVRRSTRLGTQAAWMTPGRSGAMRLSGRMPRRCSMEGPYRGAEAVAAHFRDLDEVLGTMKVQVDRLVPTGDEVLVRSMCISMPHGAGSLWTGPSLRRCASRAARFRASGCSSTSGKPSKPWGCRSSALIRPQETWRSAAALWARQQNREAEGATPSSPGRQLLPQRRHSNGPGSGAVRSCAALLRIQGTPGTSAARVSLTLTLRLGGWAVDRRGSQRLDTAQIGRLRPDVTLIARPRRLGGIAYEVSSKFAPLHGPARRAVFGVPHRRLSVLVLWAVRCLPPRPGLPGYWAGDVAGERGGCSPHVAGVLRRRHRGHPG